MKYIVKSTNYRNGLCFDINSICTQYTCGQVCTANCGNVCNNLCNAF